MTPDDILKSDPKAQYIFRGYENLSAKGREHLLSYIKYLEAEEKEKKKNK